MSGRSQILLATTNQGKVREIAPFLYAMGVDVFDLSSVGIDKGFVESGDTFEQNARLKALHYHKIHDVPTIADDSGLVIDALNGEPGVHSSRFLGEEMDYQTKMNHILERMAGLPEEKRTAHFACTISLAKSSEIYCTITKRVYGSIALSIKGKNGFGYDPIFFSHELRCTFGEADQEEKHRVSHRGKAIRSLVQLFETHEVLRNEFMISTQ